MRGSAGWLQGVRPYALFVGLCLFLYLPGISAIPPLDRDEARFAQATRQMLETGDFLRIRFQDEARNKKPAGIYWLQAALGQRLQHPSRDGNLALPPALAPRRNSGGFVDLGAGHRAVWRGERAPAHCGNRGGAPGERAWGGCRGAYRQDRRGAPRRGDGRAGSTRSCLCAGACGPAGPGLGRHHVLDRRTRRDLSQGSAGADLGRRDRAVAGNRRSRLALAAPALSGSRHHCSRHCAGAMADRDRARHRRRLSRRRARPRSDDEADRRAGITRCAAVLVSAVIAGEFLARLAAAGSSDRSRLAPP